MMLWRSGPTTAQVHRCDTRVFPCECTLAVPVEGRVEVWQQYATCYFWCECGTRTTLSFNWMLQFWGTRFDLARTPGSFCGWSVPNSTSTAIDARRQFLCCITVSPFFDHILGGGFIFFWKTFHPYKLEMIPICNIFFKWVGWTQPPGSIYPSMDFRFQPRYGNPLYLPDQQVGLNTLAVPPRLGRNKKNMRRVDIYNHNWPDVNVSLCNPYPFVINYI